MAIGCSRQNFPAALVVVLLLTLLPLLAACNDNAAPAGGGHGDGDTLFPKLPKVTGHIDRVEANLENPRHFRTLEITDGQGQRWRFQSEGWVGVSVGHLKDHQIHGTSVTVWYEKRAGGELMARFVGD